MSKNLKESTKKLLTYTKSNALELWTGATLYVGVPLVAGLYLDFRASLTAFVVMNATVGLIALRNKQ